MQIHIKLSDHLSVDSIIFRPNNVKRIGKKFAVFLTPNGDSVLQFQSKLELQVFIEQLQQEFNIK